MSARDRGGYGVDDDGGDNGDSDVPSSSISRTRDDGLDDNSGSSRNRNESGGSTGVSGTRGTSPDDVADTSGSSGSSNTSSSQSSSPSTVRRARSRGRDNDDDNSGSSRNRNESGGSTGVSGTRGISPDDVADTTGSGNDGGAGDFGAPERPDVTTSGERLVQRRLAVSELDDVTVTDVGTDDVRVRDGSATLTDEATRVEAEARTTAETPDRDFPRTPADVGGADFREDTVFRGAAERLTRSGFELGSGAVSTGLDVAGVGDTADRAVLERIGGTLGATPGAAVTTAVDVDQAAMSVTGAGARGGPTAALDQLTDISADAFDSAARGADQTFDVGERTSAGPFGTEVTTPSLTVEDDAREDLAVSLTAGALTLPAGVAAGAAGRRVVSRAPTSLDDIGRRFRGRPTRARVVSDGGFDADEALEQETITIERMADEDVETSIESVEDIPGVSISRPESRTVDDIDVDQLARRLREEETVGRTRTRTESDTDLTALERAEQRVPPAREFPDAETRQVEVDQLARRLRERESRTDVDISAGLVEATTTAAALGGLGGARESAAVDTQADGFELGAIGVAAQASATADEQTAATAADQFAAVSQQTATDQLTETTTATQTTQSVAADTLVDIDTATTTTAQTTAATTSTTALTRPRRPPEAPSLDSDALEDDLIAFDTAVDIEDVEFETQTLDEVAAELNDVFEVDRRA